MGLAGRARRVKAGCDLTASMPLRSFGEAFYHRCSFARKMRRCRCRWCFLMSSHPSVGPLWFRRLWWCLISAFAPCVSYLNILLGSKTTGGFYFLFICLFACELLIFCRLFIYLIIYLFMFAIYLFGTCVYSLLSFRWFPFPFVFTANNSRCYFIFIYFIVNVRWEVRKVNGLINWWSNMSWAGGWVWQQVISHHNGGKKSCSKLSLSNCKTLMIKLIIMPPTSIPIDVQSNW